MFRSKTRSSTAGLLFVLYITSMVILITLPGMIAEDAAPSTMTDERVIGMMENNDNWLATLIGGSIMLICGIIILIIYIMAVKKIQMKGRLNR